MTVSRWYVYTYNMKEFFVSEARARKLEVVASFFVILSLEVRTRHSGDPYVTFVFADKTGQIPGKLWQKVDQCLEIARDDIVKVQARVMEYQGRPEFAVERIRKADESEVDLADFLPTTSHDVEMLWQSLNQAIGEIADLNIRQLLRFIVEGTQVASMIRRAPAATLLHHAYLGGLLEHIVSLCRLCSLVQQNYPWMNRDLLTAAAVLHDIGKLDELEYQRRFAYTDRGQLIGHISLGVDLLRRAADEIGTPPALRDLLEHLVLSHHGKKEFGSPVEPEFAEALLFHELDNIDAKTTACWAALQNGQGLWTERVRSLDRKLLRPAQYYTPGVADYDDGT